MVCAPPYTVTLTLSALRIFAICCAKYTNHEGATETYVFSCTIGYSSTEAFRFLGFEASKEDGETENEFADLAAFNAFIMHEGAPRFGPGTFAVHAVHDVVLSPLDGFVSAWRAASIVNTRVNGGEPFTGPRPAYDCLGDDFDVVRADGTDIPTPLRYAGSAMHISRADVKDIWLCCMADYFAANANAGAD